MNYRVYPVTQTEDICNDYRVFLDGKEVELNTARVSAYPFNRRWPGHQRQIVQTELVNFLSMELSGAVKVKIVPAVKGQSVAVRPKRLGIVPEIGADGSIEFTLEHPAHFTVEPYGTHHALHIFADPPKDYGIDPKDENVLYFGAGEHNVGFLELKSGQTLFLDEGAVVYATLNALHADHIRILGRGILDNRYNKEKILFAMNAVGNEMEVDNAERLYPVEIDGCNDIEIDGITIRDPLVYNINFCSCTDARVNNVKIIGDWRFNSDGVHFANCINGSLTNSFLRTYDDSVCVRGLVGSEKKRLLGPDMLDECRNIRIENNVIWNDWGVCFRIGAAMLAERVCDVSFVGNDIIHVTGSAFDCLHCDYADAYGFTYRDINIELDDTILPAIIQHADAEQYEELPKDPDNCPPIISMQLIHHPEYSNVEFNREGRCGQLHDMCFDQIRIFGRHGIVFSFAGFDAEHLCKNITFTNLFRNGTSLAESELTLKCNPFCDRIVYRTENKVKSSQSERTEK